MAAGRSDPPGLRRIGEGTVEQDCDVLGHIGERHAGATRKQAVRGGAEEGEAQG